VDGLCVAQLGGERDGAMVAYDLATGDEKWKWTEDGMAYASPVLATIGGTKAIVAETNKNIVIIALADGKLAWETPFAVQGGRAYNACTPIVDGQTIIFSGSGRGTRAVRIEKEGSKFDAKELWSNSDFGVQFNTPIVNNGFVFGISDRDKLFCINEETGKAAWSTDIKGNRGYGSIVDAGTILLAKTPKSDLIVFEPSDKEFKQLASYKVADSDVYAYPVISGKRIFIKDKDAVTLLMLE